MTDDVKAAVELMRENARNKCQCADCNAQRAVLPWLDGEAGRTAAAVAAAREEQAQSDLTSMMHSHATGESWSPSLTATPLADRIAELEAAGKELVAYNTKHFDRATAEFARAEKAEAERDALRAQVEAARAFCEGRIRTHWRVPDVYITANDVLRAMDGAKP